MLTAAEGGMRTRGGGGGGAGGGHIVYTSECIQSMRGGGEGALSA